MVLLSDSYAGNVTRTYWRLRIRDRFDLAHHDRALLPAFTRVHSYHGFLLIFIAELLLLLAQHRMATNPIVLHRVVSVEPRGRLHNKLAAIVLSWCCSDPA